MSEETVLRSNVSPPGVPLKILKQPLPPPVSPPKITAADTGASTKPKQSTVRPEKERRVELQGLEGGDPRSTVHLIKRGIRNSLGTLPLMLRKYGWAIPVTLFVWTVLQAFNAYQLAMSMPSLAGFWMSLNKLVLLLVFLTASYNSFVGKAVYATLIVKVGIPMVTRIRRDGIVKVSGEFKSLVPNLKKSWSLAGGKSLGLLVLFAGAGAFVSNFLTRNNAVDKIAVSLVIAMSLMKALSDGHRSLPFMTGRVVMKDIFVAMKKPSPVRNHHIYVAISGLVVGFLCCLPLAVLRKSLGENIGYLLGMSVMVVGIVLLIALGKKTANEKTT